MGVRSRRQLNEEGLALAALLRSHRIVVDAVERRLRAEVGLSFPLFEALFVLKQSAEDRLRMVDVTRSMCVSKSNVTQLIDRLERLGLVARDASPTDRRLVYAKLTERGRQAADEGLEIFNAAAHQYLAQYMTKGELEKTSSGLGKVIAAMEPDGVVPDSAE
jgi:DNA-binding MarR family transcriptional regulator